MLAVQQTPKILTLWACAMLKVKRVKYEKAVISNFTIEEPNKIWCHGMLPPDIGCRSQGVAVVFVYSYAYPQVWEGGFESCNWKIGDCLAPMEGKDCVNYKCDHLQIQCPPPGKFLSMKMDHKTKHS